MLRLAVVAVEAGHDLTPEVVEMILTAERDGKSVREFSAELTDKSWPNHRHQRRAFALLEAPIPLHLCTGVEAPYHRTAYPTRRGYRVIGGSRGGIFCWGSAAFIGSK